MQRYFLNEAYEGKATYVLSDEVFHHMIHVMRMQVGAAVYLVFSDRQVITAEIIEIEKQSVQLQEVAKEVETKELPVFAAVACGFPKGDKLEWIVQKTTELGVHQLIAFPSQTSVVKWDQKKRAAKQKRLQKIALEASEQAHRQVCPEVLLLAKEHELLALFQQFDTVVIAYEEAAKKGERQTFATILTQLKKGARVLFVIGPEGGFSEQEMADFIALGGQVCGLGARILRAETAPIFMLSALGYELELRI